MKHFAYIDEIIISNGDVDSSVNYIDNKVTVYDDSIFNTIYCLDLRFVCGLRAKNNDIIIIDDDLYIEEEELHKVVSAYRSNPNRIVGVFGRSMEHEYVAKDVYGDVDIILTRLLICQKKLCSLFFMCKPMIEHIYRNGAPYGNGEDIFLSFIASIYYKCKHTCLTNIRTTNLPQHNAIWHNKNHLPYRNELSAYLRNNRHIFTKLIDSLKI